MHPIPYLDDLRREAAYDHVIELFRRKRIVLPTLRQLVDPTRVPALAQARLQQVDPDVPDPLNLFRVHWYNAADRRRRVDVPQHLVLPSSLTGVDARIVVALANRFPLVGAHKVLAAYGCLVPRLVAGHFDPLEQRAVWPSTGNYCRGGIAISKLMGCSGIAVLPEGMSRERFEWLERWTDDPAHVIRTAGSESDVRAIYDRCRELARDDRNAVLNQFSEFGNYLVHYTCTGKALETVAEAVRAEESGLRIRAFVAATGSGGTLAAGDYLKERYGARVVAAEPLECPTMLYNGFGAHNIQGIGDKHVSLIHNVMNTDVVTAVSDRTTDALNVLFNSESGREYLEHERKVPTAVVNGLSALGLSSICNVIAAIKTAKLLRLGASDVLLTVATDGAEMYLSERDRVLRREFGGRFDAAAAARTFAQHISGTTTDHTLELSSTDRTRIFNLGYYTWVEQEGVPFDDFVARREPAFWRTVQKSAATIDELIVELNARTEAPAAVPV